MERLLLVFDERILLPVASQSDALLEVVHRKQVVFPLLVQQLQHDHALGVAHAFDADLLTLGFVALADLLGELVRQPLPIQPVQVEFLEIHPEVRMDVAVQARDVVRVRMRPLRTAALHIAAHRVADKFKDAIALVLALEHFAPPRIDGLALLVHHVVVLEHVLAGFEMLGLDGLLRCFDALGDQAGFDRHVLLHAELEHERLHAVPAENPHQVVLQGEVEARLARIALPPGPTAQLVVDAARLVPLGAEHVEAAKLDHLVVLGVGLHTIFRERLLPHIPVVGMVRGDALPPQVLASQELGIAAQQDVGAATGHVGRNGDGTLATRLSDDPSFALVVLGVEHLVRHSPPLEHAGEQLGLLNGDRADQHGLAELLAFLDVRNGVAPLLLHRAVDDVVVLGPDHGLIGGHDHNFQVVDLAELRRLGVRRARHARQLGVHAEIILECDRRQGLVLALDGDPFLGLHGLVQPVRPAAAGHQTPRELVDDHDLAVLDDIVLVTLEHHVRLEALLDGVLGVVIHQLVDVADVESLLDLGLALLGEPSRAVLFLKNEISRIRALAGLVAFDGLALLQFRDHLVGGVVLVGRNLGRPGNDQRSARLIDQDRVDFVDDGEVMPALDMVSGVEFHVVAQVVEAELVIGAVGDVRPVAFPALLVGEAVDDHADAQAQPAVDPPHPLGVALGEIVVHGHDVDAAPGNGIEIDRQGGRQRLALAGLHLGDLALVQHHAADQLHVEMAHAHDAPRGFPAGGESFGQQIVQGLAVAVALLELVGLGLQLLVREGFEFGCQRADVVNPRSEALDFALVLGPEDPS